MLVLFGSFINKERALAMHKNNNVVQSINKPFIGSTLDSLQGTWISNKDSTYKVIISSNKMYSYSENQCLDTANIFLASSCIGYALSLYNTTEVNGKTLILYSAGSTYYNFCYNIGYLSDISLELIFDGKLLPFTKQ